MLTQVGALRHQLEVLISQMDLSINSTKLAGRLTQFLKNWEQITQDRWVLQAISGYQLELTQTPWQAKPMPQINCSTEEQEMISQEIKELLVKGAIVETTLSIEDFVSQIFLVEKKVGGQRLVINLKSLNTFVRVDHFKMEGLHILPDLILAQDWMIKIDLKDAYLQVPIHQQYQHLLQFQWSAKVYQFQCLPFGLKSAPRVFSKVMKPVVGTLRHMGIRLIIYLGDILILHQVKEELIQAIPLICQFFETLGLVINQKKSILIPQQRIEFLGFLVDATTLHLVFPAEKLRKVQQLAQHLLCQQTVSVRELARFVGKTSASQRAIWQAPLHYRALQFLINSVVPTDQSPQEGSDAKFNTNLRLTREAETDLTWWSSLDRKIPWQSPLCPKLPSKTIESDASNMGWGARQGEQQTGGRWSMEEASHRINYLELLAAFLALQCFAKHGHKATILMRLDSVTAVTYINKLGGTRFVSLP